MDATRVKEIAGDLGFALCGVAAAAPTDHRDHVLDWLAAGRHGSMAWLAEQVDLRLDPRELLPGARSVICVADFIGPGDSEITDLKSQDCPGRIARYAQFDDYHVVLKRRLHRMADLLRERFPGEQFRACVDTAPVLEREVHQRAGLGWIGKNTMLIHPDPALRGSHLLLGEILTTLALTPDAPESDHCGTCTSCIDACPTRCITPYEVDASRCISYLTIEHRGPIEPSLHTAMGDWLYGCDVCQEVCPYNQSPPSASPPTEYGQSRPATMDALWVLDWTQEDRRAAFTRSAMKRAKLNQMKRNALIVLGNRATDRPEVVERIHRIAGDEAEEALVRQTAREILDRIPVAIKPIH